MRVIGRAMHSAGRAPQTARVLQPGAEAPDDDPHQRLRLRVAAKNRHPETAVNGIIQDGAY